MKKLLSLMAGGLLTMAAPLSAQRTLKAPAALGCMNIYRGSLTAREVVFADTATTVRFTMDYRPGSEFSISSRCYLIDEAGKRYPLRSSAGLPMDTWVTSPANRTTDFTLHFEPLPKRTRVFDFMEGDSNGSFMLLGIHDPKHKLHLPATGDLPLRKADAKAGAVPTRWFVTDSVTLRGRIEGYQAGAGFPTTIEGYLNNQLEKDDQVLLMEIQPDGTFTKRWKADYPMVISFSLSEPLPGMSRMEVYAVPGETIDVALRKGDDGQYRCHYLSGSSRDVARWLGANLDFSSLSLSRFEGSAAQAAAKADTLWQLMAYRLQRDARRHGFTPQEMQLAKADAQACFAKAVMDYAVEKQFAGPSEQRTAADSADIAALSRPAFYSPLFHRIDFDNPLMMASGAYDILVNRMTFSMPIQIANKPVVLTDGDVWAYTPDTIKHEMEIRYAVWREMMGSDKDNLLAQMCLYRNVLGDYGMWRNLEKTRSAVLADTTLSPAERQRRAERVPCASQVIPAVLPIFPNEGKRRQGAQYHAYRQAQVLPVTPLPEGIAADIVRSLQKRYPGRYLLIDFWGMNCGPCRAAIQSSKALREEIARRWDIKLVFIADEETAEGSEAYHKYVSEWLANEETICLSHADFARLQEAFRFNAIPHYETITPEGQRVDEEYRFKGLYNFEMDMKHLRSAFE